MRRFIDTNVLLYADDMDAGAKRERARAVLRDALTSAEGVVSTQVLQEFFVISTAKLGVEPRLARSKVQLIARMDLLRIELATILAAIDLLRLHALSFWDALIVASASAAGCRVLLTEDLQHGQVFDGVRVEDPFRGLEPAPS
jgi:predicted nucleic acid-binding protein